VSIRGVSNEYEHRLWDELNTLLADLIPDDPSETYTEGLILAAFKGADPEIADLYERIVRLAKTERGYLRERLEEDNPVATARRELEERHS